MKFGIALTRDGGHPDATGAEIVGWKQDDAGQDETWDDYGAALEANDLDGWRGYVRVYPTGVKVLST